VVIEIGNRNRAVFLDRDGVINRDPPHYAHRIDQLMLIEGSGMAIKQLNNNGFTVIVITNQSGIAKGYYAEEDMKVFNEAMIKLLHEQDANIDAIYHCPHHPDAQVEKYRMQCDCRKPKPGMILEAGKAFNIDFSSSFLVGDKWSDIEAGRTAGCSTILVMTGHGRNEYAEKRDPVDYVADNLLEAVTHYILGKDKSA
jgi:D-glycero-D-manno-heptose 1,7-bisphosphate phosphatase